MNLSIRSAFGCVQRLSRLHEVSKALTAFKPLTGAPASLNQIRWSQWPREYIDPFPTKPELEPIIEDEQKMKELAFTPIRAAPASITTSIFYDEILQTYINVITRFGRMSLSRRLIHETLAHIKRLQLAKYWAAKTDEEKAKIELNPVAIFHQAIYNCRPVIVTKKVKRGGAYYNVPYPTTPKRSLFLAMKWMNDEVKDRPKPRLTHYPEELAREMLRAINFEGKVYKRKVDMHKLAESNKAYAHYRWG